MAKLAPAIETTGLSKKYSNSAVFSLSNLDLKIMPGEVYGFLGPNGAGKSTTIRLLMNFIQPTKGTAKILGKDIVSDSVAIKQSVGYLSGEVALYSKMTGRQFLDYMADVYSIRNGRYTDELAERFQADLGMRIRDLSKGNRQKIGLLQAFMHKPKILILDEPTSGLDPLMQEEFFKLLKETTSHGGTAFVSSHNLAEVQKMCDRVGFIRDGKLILEQKMDELIDMADRTFDIVFAGNVPKKELTNLKDLRVISSSAGQATITVHGDLAPLFSLLASQKVVSFNQREVNLEDEFLDFYKRSQE